MSKGPNRTIRGADTSRRGPVWWSSIPTTCWHRTDASLPNIMSEATDVTRRMYGFIADHVIRATGAG
jgi:hypothetical protein